MIGGRDDDCCCSLSQLVVVDLALGLVLDLALVLASWEEVATMSPDPVNLLSLFSWGERG